MSMTITEKILARAAGRHKVSAGEIITCRIDLICVDEIQIPIFKRTLEEIEAKSIDKDLTVFVTDHYCPPTSLNQARAIQMLREFTFSQGLTPLEGGVKHQLLMERGAIRPGMVVAATDSHINTCGALGAFAAAFGPSEAAMMALRGECWLKVPETIRCEINGGLQPFVTPKDIGLFILREKGMNFANYKAIEFCGQAVRRLPVDGRIALCNMSTEMGAKNGIIEVDSVTERFLKMRNIGDYTKIASDMTASFYETLIVDASKLEPLVAIPHSPGNVKPVSEVMGTKIDQAFIGSCLGGNIDDLRLAANILKHHPTHPRTRLIITPASRAVYLQAVSEGLIAVFLRAKATVSGMTCSVCAGLEGILLPGEVCISTSPRNFKGRMGSPGAYIYLASPATVAASAIRGEITDPREFC